MKLSLNQYTPVNLIRNIVILNNTKNIFQARLATRPYIKCFDDTVYEGKPVTYTTENEDDDVAQIFLDKLEKDLRHIWRIKKFKDPTTMIFTVEDKRNYDKATKCHICGKDMLKVTKRRTKSEPLPPDKQI